MGSDLCFWKIHLLESVEWVETGAKEETAVVCRRCNDCLILEAVRRYIKALPSSGRAAVTEE